MSWSGVVTHLHTANVGSEPMVAHDRVNLSKGVGIDGDRYATGRGFYSEMPEPGRQITLLEIETLEALQRDHDIVLEPAEHRRNVTVKGVQLNHLVGTRFQMGNAILKATRLSTPCKHIEDVTGKTISRWLINRSGLNCIIEVGGAVSVGDGLKPA